MNLRNSSCPGSHDYTRKSGDPLGSPLFLQIPSGLDVYGARYLAPQYRVLIACELHCDQGYHCDEDYE